MRSLRLIIALMLLSLVLGANAQVTKRSGNDTRKKDKKDGTPEITTRQQSFYEVKEPHDADLQWMKVVQRELNISKGKNAAIFYPEMPNEDGESLYFIIMRLLAKGQISAYDQEYRMFDDAHKINFGEFLDNRYIDYTLAKGSTEKNPVYEFEDADILSNMVKSYYIIEKWEFDTRSNQMKPRVEALCPVIHREDDWSGETAKYPLFWVKLNDIRPYMAQQYVFTDDDNNLPRYSLDDFFKLNMYTGDIIWFKNLHNLSLRQMFPDTTAYRNAQDSIENRLRSFNKDLWIPPLEVLQAQAEAEEEARAAAEAAEAELEEGEEDAEQVEAAEGEEGNVERTTKRATKMKEDAEKESKSKSKSKSKKSKSTSTSKAKAKEKKTKVKERKPKNTTQAPNPSVRSVRNRKK